MAILYYMLGFFLIYLFQLNSFKVIMKIDQNQIRYLNVMKINVMFEELSLISLIEELIISSIHICS